MVMRWKDADGDREDAMVVVKTPRAHLRPFDAGGAHNRGHLAVRSLTGDGPQGSIRAFGDRLDASADVLVRGRERPASGSCNASGPQSESRSSQD